jgi:8-oxo-dGTP pyrophosphatase MutT (NUDIX family)
MISSEDIHAAVGGYLRRYPAEANRLAPLTDALDAGGELTSRRTFTGHVTCSAIVVGPTGLVLHIRHNALKRWLPPGGHLEAEDINLIAAVLREVTEETGIPAAALHLVDETPIDIDVHPIPANPAKGEPDHRHFDLCYAFTTTVEHVTLQADEVHDFTWLPIAGIEPHWLAERIAAAVTLPA